jgi:transposase
LIKASDLVDLQRDLARHPDPDEVRNVDGMKRLDPRVPRLRSVPSVGPVTAAAFLAAIDDAQRFRHAHQLEAYLGLVPREYSSGETQRRGPLTKAGHSRTRWLLIQAAVSILRRRPPQAEELRTWALRIAARRGKQVAVVALARRLAGILYALLRDDSVFEPQRVRHPRPIPAALVAM